MRSRVSFQIERIIESFPTKRAQVPLDVRMAFHVPVQQTLQGESLVAYPASEVGLAVFRSDRGHFGFVFSSRAASHLVLIGQRVFDAVTSVDEF